MKEKNFQSFCFEPLKFVVRSDVDPKSSTRFRRTSRYIKDVRSNRIADEHVSVPGPGHSYFFQKAITENVDEFESINIINELRKIFQKGTNNIQELLRKKFDGIIPTSTVDSLIPDIRPDYYYLRNISRGLARATFFHKKLKVGLIPISPVVMYLFGCKKEDISKVINKIDDRCQELNKVTSDFGLQLVEVLSGKKFQTSHFNDISNIENIEIGEPKNDFEKEVIQECEKTTSSFLPNANVKFNEPVENFEYDLLIGFGENSNVIIEPTDYESLQTEIINGKFGTETMKSRIILGTLDKARRLKAESIVVVKGFSKEKYSALNSLAKSRGINLMSDETYKKDLPSVLMEFVMQKIGEQ